MNLRMDVVTGELTPMTVSLPIAALVLLWFWRTYLRPSTSSNLPALPIVGYDQKQWFGWARVRAYGFKNFREIYQEAYEKYLSKGKPCIVTDPGGVYIVLPPSLGQWLVNQPDNVVSASMRQNDFLQTKYTFPTPKMTKHPYHIDIIKRDLTRKLNMLTEDIWEELDRAFQVYWGNDPREWREINLMETIMRIVTRTANRVFVGKELCQNERYLDLCTLYARDVPVNGMLINLIPEFLQSLLAPIITLPSHHRVNKIRSMLRPEIDRRLGIPKGDKDAPNDFLQWYITYARDSLEADEGTPETLADRIAIINFATVHTSTFTTMNAITDIISSPEKDSFLGMIQAEVEEILSVDNGLWTKTSVQRMRKTDSTLRESMRISTFQTGGIQRSVLAKDGVTTPDGLHIRYGNKVEVPAWPTHMEPRNYPDPDKFIPLRFFQGPIIRQNGGDGSHKTAGDGGAMSSVDTSLEFLSFGHGRHACPGRFFATNEIKLILAYIARYYDIEPLLMEPRKFTFGNAVAPNPKLTARIKRKVGT